MPVRGFLELNFPALRILQRDVEPNDFALCYRRSVRCPGFCHYRIRPKHSSTGSDSDAGPCTGGRSCACGNRGSGS